MMAFPQLIPLLLFSSFSFGQSEELRFLVLGDWGGMLFYPYTTYYERAVSKTLGKVAEEFGTQFTIGLGDNFYEFGVKNEDDPRFQETFENVFTAKSLMTPWYFCAGNHDHYGNVSAEIAYSTHSERWNFPSLYYTKSWRIPGSDLDLQLVLLDTIVLCGNTDHDHLNDQPQEPESVEKSEEQWTWLEDTLKSSTAHYVIVGGHFPVWSIAEHGPTQCLVERLKPLLEKYNVTAYISGHDHNLQHLKEQNSSVEYFVVGCAGKMDTSRSHRDAVPGGSSRFFWAEPSKDGGFALVRAAVSNMTLEFVDAHESMLYTRNLYPRDIHELRARDIQV
ncbi:tartrate-resistant acid phosphatase type 5-like [Montipora capricornis]|uniref:tartrate-resistant acid phosphatase type 5-like n=1 Tax=Montipora capricornis TaxID=246305 RepID=UPI0035F184CD